MISGLTRLVKPLFLVTIVFSNIAAETRCIPPLAQFNKPCEHIMDWVGFKNVISSAKAGEKMHFCPFSITKPSNDKLLIEKSIMLLCQSEANSCMINAEGSTEGTIVQIKGDDAEVTMFGFVFMNAGASSSAVHVGFNAGLGVKKQTLCSCSFMGNKGNTRGVALRTEPKTKVLIMDCTFENNEVLSIGTVFNRGNLAVESCTFIKNSGIGGAIGSSRGSKTTLIRNKFIENFKGPMIFSHNDGDIVDKGGNIAVSTDLNTKCQGIFILKGQRCIEMNVNPHIQMSIYPTSDQAPTRSPNLSFTTNPSRSPMNSVVRSYPDIKCQKHVSVEKKRCIQVHSFAMLKTRILQAHAGETLIFCSFDLQKAPEEEILVESNINIACKKVHKCRISGPRGHIGVRGESAEFHIQGFVFEGAGSSSTTDTEVAIHILSGTKRPQSICECIFTKCKGNSRGVALLTERQTDVLVSNCMFKWNESSDIGAAIFTRGKMMISETVFLRNNGTSKQGGSAIGCAPRAPLQLRNNRFEKNLGRPIFLHDDDAIDLGGNIAFENDKCNGIYNQRGGNKCTHFLDGGPVPVTSRPTHSPISNAPNEIGKTSARRGYGGEAYFNYDIDDHKYGPLSGGWSNVNGNAEFLRFVELNGTLMRKIENKCAQDLKESPIDLCDDIINDDCHEHHQTRTHSGNVVFGQQVKAEILPSKLRLRYYKDRTPLGGPYPPEADFAFNWNGFIEVNHIDVKVPSEHTICGKRYPAEYSIFMTHPLRRQTIVMSILLEVDPNGNDNEHFQKVIDQWQIEYNINDSMCNDKTRRRAQFRADDYDPSLMPSHFEDLTYAKVRHLKDTTPYGTGGWDPFHPSMERSIYHWGYWGSLTEPPCSNFVAWRVLTKPAYISQKQLEQLKAILFTYRDGNCEYTSVADPDIGVARPIQAFKNRKLYKCTADNYVSDAEKDYNRKITGNPDWCC